MGAYLLRWFGLHSSIDVSFHCFPGLSPVFKPCEYFRFYCLNDYFSWCHVTSFGLYVSSFISCFSTEKETKRPGDSRGKCNWRWKTSWTRSTSYVPTLNWFVRMILLIQRHPFWLVNGLKTSFSDLKSMSSWVWQFECWVLACSTVCRVCSFVQRSD